MKLLSVILLLTILRVALTAQDHSGRIDGVVNDSDSGLPLADVKVQVIGPKSVSATTGKDGHFVLEGLTAGQYQVVTVSDRYAPVRGVWRSVKPEESLQALTLTLTPWGIASGIVMDSGGKPVSNAVVMAFRRGYSAEGIPSFRLDPDRQISQSTNDRGEFRLFRLDPADYYFHVEPPSNGPPLTLRAPPFWPVYYPGTADAEKAVAVTIKGGEEVRLGTVTVLPSSDSILRLHILNLSGEILNTASRMVTLRLSPAQTLNFTVFGGTDAPESDVIEFHGLPPGPHEILVSWSTSKGTAQGLATVVAGPSNSEAELRVRSGSRISGNALNENAQGAAPLPGLRCMLQSSDLVPPRLLAMLIGTSGPDGTFSIDNVPAAEYRIQCSGLPTGSSIRGIRLETSVGTQMPLVDRFKVGGETNLKVVVASSIAEIQGQVSGSNGQGVQGATVVLVPDASTPARKFLYRTAMTDENGTFLIQDIIPETYRLFAWQELRDPSYFNDDFMKPYLQYAKPVRVDADFHLTANLTVLD